MKSTIHKPFSFVTWCALVPLVFCTCKKEEIKEKPTIPDYAITDGRTPGYPVAAGYMYAYLDYRVTADTLKPRRWKLNTYAFFRDPEGNLCSAIDPNKNQLTIWSGVGNLNVGTVSINEFPSTWNGSGNYTCSPQTELTPDTSVVWHVEGREGFPGFTQAFESAFPRALRPDRRLWLVKEFGYKVEVADIFDGYDSICLVLPKYGVAAKRRDESFIVCNPSTMDTYYTEHYDSLHVQLQAFKYYHTRRNGRNFQFLFVTNLWMQTYIVGF